MIKTLIKCCPSCSHEDPVVTEHIVYRISCKKCGTHTSKTDLSTATINWNEHRVRKVDE